MYNRDPFYVNPHMSLVYTNTKGVCLWLGDYSAAVNEKNLKKYDIMAVLTVAREEQISYPSHLNINHKIIPAIDHPNYSLRPHFAESRDFILENMLQGKHVLVHCSSGISRSPTIILAFLMQKLNLTYLRAFAYLKKKRNCVEPNYGFKGELTKFQKKLNSLQVMKSQFKKSEQTTPHSINQIADYLKSQKQSNKYNLMNLLNRKSTQPSSNFSIKSVSYRSPKNSNDKDKIRKRVKSEMHGSLPRIS